MSKVHEIVFDDNVSGNGDGYEVNAPTVSLDGWFTGYGDMLTVDDLATILHVSRKTIQKQCKRGNLPAISIGRRWYVPKARLVEFLLNDRDSQADRL